MLDFSEVVTSSELCAVDRVFALRSQIRSRIARIRSEWNFVLRVDMQEIVKPDYAVRARAAVLELSDLEARLDISSVISHTDRDVREVFADRGTVNDELLDIFGPGVVFRPRAAPEPWIKRYLADLKESGCKARVAEHKWRLIEGICDAVSNGWFICFNTLTVDNNNYDVVFSKGSLAWRDYIRAVDRAVGQHCFGSVRLADEARKNGRDYHCYYGVVERGAVHGRLHIHVVHCFRDLPPAWRNDPNRGLAVPKRREITKLKAFWKFGHSRPIACRFGQFDAFSKIGWVWPVSFDKRSKRWQPVLAKPCVALARYVAKYLEKAYYRKEGAYQWRTRMSRGFGLKRLTATISSWSDRMLVAAMVQPVELATHPEVRLPPSRVRLTVLRESVKRLRKRYVGGKKASIILSRFWKVSPRRPIVERLRCMIREKITFNSQNCGNTKVPTWIGLGVSECRKSLQEAFTRDNVSRVYLKGGACHA